MEDEEDESGESFEFDLLSCVAATRAMAGDLFVTCQSHNLKSQE